MVMVTVSSEISLRIADADANSSPSSSAESSFRELDDAFLQTQTRIWLGEVLQRRLDEQMNVTDLIADGELLYQVSEVIWKMLRTMSMDTSDAKVLEGKSVTSGKSTGRYMPYYNVASFLRICKLLGLDGIDLFTPSDVVEKRDIRKVCMCIRSVSKKARSRSLHVPDFDIVTYTVAMPTDMVECLRRTLELSQSSSSVSCSYDSYKDAKVGSRNWKKKSSAACIRSSGYCSDGSEESDSCSMIIESDRLSLTYDDGMSPDLLMLRDHDTDQVGFQSNMRDHERDDIGGEYMPLSAAESVGSRCSLDSSDNELDSVQSSSYNCSHNNCEVLQRGSNSILCGSGALNHIPFHLSWEDGSLDVDSGTLNAPETNRISNDVVDTDLVNIGTNKSCASSFTSASDEDALPAVADVFPNLTQPALGMRHKTSSYGNIEDAESMSSLCDGDENKDLHHKCLGEGFMAGEILTPSLEYSCSQYRSSVEECGSPGSVIHNTAIRRSSFDTERLYPDVKLEDDSPLKKLLQPTSNWLSTPLEDTDSHVYENEVPSRPLYSEVANDQGISGYEGHLDGNTNQLRGLLPEQSCDTVNFNACSGDCLHVVVGGSNRSDDQESSCNVVPLEPALALSLNSGVGLLASNTDPALKDGEEDVSYKDVVKSDPCTERRNYDINMESTSSIEGGPCNFPDTPPPPSMAVKESSEFLGKKDTLDQDIQVHQETGEHNLDARSFSVESMQDVNDCHHEICMDHKNLQCEENTTKDEMTQLEVNGNEEKPQRKARRIIIKSIVRGSAVVGMIFLFLRVRKSQQEHAEKASRKPGQLGSAGDGNVMKNKPLQKRKDGGSGSVYPAEKLRFSF